MAFVYEVNGQRISFEREPTDADIDEAAKSLGTQTKPKQKDTSLFGGTPVEAVAGGLEAGLSALSGMASVPASAAASLFSGGKIKPEDVQRAMTFQPTTAKGQEYAEGLGRLMTDSKLPPIMVGPLGMMGSGRHTQSMAPGASMVAGQTANAGRAVAQVPRDVGKGVMNVARSPDKSVASVPITEQTIKQATTPRPAVPNTNIPELAKEGPAQVGRLGELVLRTGKQEVPIGGRGVEAATENAVRTYSDLFRGKGLVGAQGFTGLADLAGILSTGVPVGSTAKAGLSAAKGIFSPLKGDKLGTAVDSAGLPFPNTYNRSQSPFAGPVQQPQPLPPTASQVRQQKQTPAIQNARDEMSGVPKLPKPVETPLIESTPVELPKPKTGQSNYQPEITNELSRMIEGDPSLARYAKDYVITEQNQYPLDNFLNQGAKQTLVYGGPGTGKTQLASEWLAKNRGELEYINTHGFDAKAATNLKNRLDTSQNPMLLLVDEADQLKPAQVELVNNLANHPNTRILYTTNDLAKIKDSIKNQSNIINMDTKLTPDQKKVFGLYRAVKGEMFGAPVKDIEAVTNTSQSFRDIKRGVPEKTGQIDTSSQKQSPMFGVQRDAIEAPPKVQKLFDDLESNALPKNMIVVDSSVYSVDPNFGTKLNSIALPTEGSIAKMLAEPTTASPTVRIVVTDESSAKQLSSLKGLIERNNETSYPTNIIVEDRHGKLDPAIRSRAITLTGKDFGANSTNPKPVKE